MGQMSSSRHIEFCTWSNMHACRTVHHIDYFLFLFILFSFMSLSLHFVYDFIYIPRIHTAPNIFSASNPLMRWRWRWNRNRKSGTSEKNTKREREWKIKVLLVWHFAFFTLYVFSLLSLFRSCSLTLSFNSKRKKKLNRISIIKLDGGTSLRIEKIESKTVYKRKSRKNVKTVSVCVWMLVCVWRVMFQSKTKVYTLAFVKQNGCCLLRSSNYFFLFYSFYACAVASRASCGCLERFLRDHAQNPLANRLQVVLFVSHRNTLHDVCVLIYISNVCLCINKQRAQIKKSAHNLCRLILQRRKRNATADCCFRVKISVFTLEHSTFDVLKVYAWSCCARLECF